MECGIRGEVRLRHTRCYALTAMLFHSQCGRVWMKAPSVSGCIRHMKVLVGLDEKLRDQSVALRPVNYGSGTSIS